MSQANPLFQNKDCRILLHCCCAPCSGAIIEKLFSKQMYFEIFFYNPNIYPEDEYLRRKIEIATYAKKKGIPFVDAEYDPQRWLAHVKGHENDPEKGARCSLCFECRLFKTAEYAKLHGFSCFSTTLSISRQKDFDQVTKAGLWAASCFPQVTYLACNWRKNGGVQRTDEIAKREQFYRQTYCGCMYSIRKAVERSKTACLASTS
jgi:epoxyqueuosine reductase